jgi:hypothetical protein
MLIHGSNLMLTIAIAFKSIDDWGKLRIERQNKRDEL